MKTLLFLKNNKVFWRFLLNTHPNLEVFLLIKISVKNLPNFIFTS